MKIHRDEKTQCLLRMILFIEIFANVKCFSFETFINVCEYLNEMKKIRKF